MNDSKKPKRTKDIETKTEAKAETKTSAKVKKKAKGPTNRVVWIFSSSDRVARQAGLNFYNPRHAAFAELRKELGVDSDVTVLPIFPETWNREKLIKDLQDHKFPNETVLLVVGQSADFRNKKVADFKGHEYYFHIPGERQYYLQSGDQGINSYDRAFKVKESMEKNLDQIFKKI